MNIKNIKQQIILFVGIGLSFTQSYSFNFGRKDYQKDGNYIMATVQNIVGPIIAESSVSVPSISLNEPFNGNIKALCRGIHCIPYRHLPYNSLSDFEKKIFDYLKFDQNKFVTIIGFVSGSYELREIMNGSFTMDSRTEYLNWDLSGSYNSNIIPTSYYKLASCPNAQASVSQLNLSGNSGIMTYKISFLWN